MNQFQATAFGRYCGEVLHLTLLLWWVFIPVIFVVKGAIDFFSEGHYFLGNYLLLFSQTTVQSAVFFGVWVAVARGWRYLRRHSHD